MNPARTKRSKYKPERVTVAVLVHIPHLTSFYEHRLEVFEVCLDSIIQNTTVRHDLMVFDNASCPEVQAYISGLHKRGPGSIRLSICLQHRQTGGTSPDIPPRRPESLWPLVMTTSTIILAGYRRS